MSFINPCLTRYELNQGSEIATTKELHSPLRLLFVGRLEKAKGVHRALRILDMLLAQDIDTTLDLVGDGPEREAVVGLAQELNIQKRVRFHGWVPRTRLGAFYAPAHIILFPSSSSEGWPKVLSEAMAYGVVPVASNVSSIPGYLQRFGCGRAFPPDDISAFVRALVNYIDHPQRWREESQRATEAASHFTYDAYLQAVASLLDLPAPAVEKATT